MGSTKSTERHPDLTAVQAAELLRGLAADLEEGTLTIDGLRAPLNEIRELRVSARPHLTGISLKLRLKVQSTPASDTVAPQATSPGVVPAPAPINGLKFKPLKKRLDRLFRSIRQSLNAGTAPTLESAQEFLVGCTRMTELTEDPDPAYGEFEALAAQLLTAVKTRDFSACAALTSQLSGQVKACHKRLK